MAQRNSDYERKDRDLYVTPRWVTEELLKHIRKPKRVWEPATGPGIMAATIRLKTGAEVIESDIATGTDFLDTTRPFEGDIITNPPFKRATQFIEHALALTKAHKGLCAFLLRVDFDSGKTRRHLFADQPAFAKKVVLLRRIIWFETEGKNAAPSENHAWYIWDWQGVELLDLPTIDYGP